MSDIEHERSPGVVEPSADETFDEWARNRGRELRRPAPADGFRDVQQRRRSQARTRAGIVGGACAVLIVGVVGVIAAQRGDGEAQVTGPAPTPSSSTVASTSTTTASSAAVTTTTATPLPAAQPLDTIRTSTIPAQGGVGPIVAVGETVGMSVFGTGLGLYDAAGGALRQTVANVAGDPIVAGFDSIWLLDSGADVMIRVDPRSGDVQATVPIPARDGGFAAVNDRGVWCVSDYPSRLLRIDPATNAVEEMPAPDTAYGVGATDDALWVATSDGNLVRLDPADGRQIASVDLGGELRQVRASGDDVWVIGRTDDLNSVIHHVDATTNRLRASLVIDDRSGQAGNFEAVVAGGSLWASPNGELLRIDPTTDAVTARYDGGGFFLATVGNTIWLTHEAARTISIIPLN